MAAKKSQKNRIAYQEFGASEDFATQRAEPNLPPQQQNLRVQASRKGRKGKTVTEITGFQTNKEELSKLLKQLKNQCGSGGTLKDNILEVQGDHKDKILQILLKLGYKAKISGG